MSTSPRSVEAPTAPAPSSSLLLAVLMAIALTIVGSSYQMALAVIFNVKKKACGDPDCRDVLFEGQQLMQFFETVGACILFLVYHLDKWMCRLMFKKTKGLFDTLVVGQMDGTKAPWYKWIIPAMADCIANTMFYYAATWMTLTYVQIFKPFRLLLIAIISMSWFKRDIKIHCWIGICFLLLSQCFSTIDDVIGRGGTSGDPNAPHRNGSDHTILYYAILLCLGGVSLLTLELVMFEYICMSHRVNPIQAIGMMGVLGIFISTSLLVFSHLIKIEDYYRTFYQLTHSKTLQLSTIWMILSVTSMNLISLAVTARFNSLFAATMLALRVGPVYVLEVIMGWLSFTILGLIAVLVNIFGILVYSGAPFKWMNEESKFMRILNARLHLICQVVPKGEERESLTSTDAGEPDEEEEILEDDDYASWAGDDVVVTPAAAKEGDLINLSQVCLYIETESTEDS